MKNINYTFVFIFVLLFAVGCGDKVSVSGKVTFPDGSPLTEGAVFFETPAMTFQGSIQKDGTYTMYSSELKGIPKGLYNIYIAEFPNRVIYPPAGSPDGASPQILPPIIPIAQKYLAPGTSELTCEVKGKTTFNITVEKP